MEDAFRGSLNGTFNFSLSQAIILLHNAVGRPWVVDGPAGMALIATYGLVLTSGLITNVLVASVVLSRARSPKHLFLLNLSLSDLLLCLFCVPFTLIELLRRHWPLGQVPCQAVPALQCAAIFVSSGSVALIAWDRQRSVLGPLRHAPRIQRTAGVLRRTAVLWTASALLSLPVGLHRHSQEVRVSGIVVYERCVEKWPHPHGRESYTILVLVAQFLIPFAVLTTTHFRIKARLTARQHANQLQLVGQPPGQLVANQMDNLVDDGGTATSNTSKDERKNGRQPKSAKGSLSLRDEDSSTKLSNRFVKELARNRRATLVLFAVWVSYAVSWLPWNALNLIVDFNPQALQPPRKLYLAFSACHLVAMSSATINPILYGWLNTNIRKEILHLFRGR